MNWSPQQANIFSQGSDLKTSFHIEALAGTGKTTVLVELANQSGLAGKFLFVAFSKLIASELEKRLPSNECKTLHALAYGVLRKNRPNVYKWNVDARKYLELFRVSLEPVKKKKSTVKANRFQELLKMIDDGYEHGSGLFMASEVINKMMITMTPPDASAIMDMADTYNVNLPLDPDEMAEFAEEALNRGRSLALDQGIVDFNEMLYYPAMHRWPVGSYHTLAIDEAQDLNAVQHEFLSLIRTERIISVGDRNQSIFGFAGAMSDSVDKLIDLFNLEQLPLSVCFRCGKDIIRHAQNIVPEIEYFDGSPQGLVREIGSRDLKANIKDGAFIICRLNAPLVTKCFQLLADGVAARIRGKDIADGLIQTIYQIGQEKHFSIDNFAYHLDAHHAKESEKIYRRGGRREKMLLQMLQDKINCLETFYNKIQPDGIPELIDGIKRLFVDDKFASVTLMSAHKSKGLEANQIFIIEPDKLPLVFPNQTDEEIRQERNLVYVARTRAKQELVYVQNERMD